MKKVIGAGVLVFFLYFIKDYARYYAFSPIINIAFILSFIYLIVVIVQYVRQPSSTYKADPVAITPQDVTKPKTTSGSLWFVGFIVIALLIFLFRETLGRNSFKIFIVLDNFVKFAPSLPPFIGWILPGLLLGAIFGSLVAWKKYKLNYTINLLPIGAFAVIMFLLIIINKPFTNERIEPADAAPESGISSGAPQELILNRWEVVDITDKNRKHLDKRKNKTQPELEFKDNGKCYIYENDVTTGFMYYTMAADGKSLVLTDPRKKDQTSRVQIISITKNELIIKSGMFENETATLKAK